VGRLRDTPGIRLVDVGAAAAVALAVELNVTTGGGLGARPLNAVAYVFGAAMAIPVLFRRNWPLRALIACSVLLLLFYTLYRRNISPAPLLSLPLYDAALAGYLVPAIVIPTVYMVIGLFVVEGSSHEGLATLSGDFLLPAVVMALAIMLGDAVRSRRVLALQTAEKLRLAGQERDAEAARAVAEERLRIARELHDTVAHSMATITVQAGSALHVLAEGQPGDPATAGQQAAPQVHDALIAIRDTSKGVLTDIRVTLGQLRGGSGEAAAGQARQAGLDRLEALSEAVRAAGAAVSVTVEGERLPLPPGTDHAAYRILQESLTNVLRHAGPDASATVRLSFAPGLLTIEVTDDGTAPAAGNGSVPGALDGSAPEGRAPAASALNDAAPEGSGPYGGPPPGAGHGLTGMAERAAAVGGRLSARPRPDGGFEVTAWLPLTPAGAAG
jgi:signal transduction histidine kinase